MNFRLAIDGVMILSFVFAAGVMWTKQDAMESQLEHLSQAIIVMNGSGERLARIETKLDVLTKQVERIQEVDSDERITHR